MDRIICAESYMASVTYSEELRNHGLRFIGVIKTETRQFLMAYLSNIGLHNQRNFSGFLTRPVDRTKLVLGDSFG